MRAPSPTGRDAEPGDAIFDHILVGIDDTSESVVAAAQAGVLRAPGGRLVLVGVAERHLAAQAGLAAAYAEDDLRAGTATDLERARELVDADDVVQATGDFVPLLCSECSRRSATLVAVGVRPHRRLPALVLGGHDLEALHDVPCSLLVARPGWGPSKPERVVVGVDGSPEADAAERTARSLAARLACPVVPVVSLCDRVEAAVLRAEREDALLDPAPLADALVAASSRGALVVVGRARERDRRRGGAVERVVYAARCSVLVVDG